MKFTETKLKLGLGYMDSFTNFYISISFFKSFLESIYTFITAIMGIINEVIDFRKDFQEIKYCFQTPSKAYEYLKFF